MHMVESLIHDLQMGHVEELHLRPDDFSQENLIFIAKTIFFNQTLHTVDMRTCHLEQEVSKVWGLVFFYNHFIRTLDLSLARVENSAALWKGLKKNTTLRHLDLSGCEMQEQEGLSYLVECLIESANYQKTTQNNSEKNNSKFEFCLDISACGEGGAGEKGGFIVSRLLEQHNYLSHLSVAENGLGKNGVKVLRENCILRKQLRYLNLSMNFLTDEGVSYLVSPPSPPSKREDINSFFGCFFFFFLHHLDLSSNSITCAGLKYISDALLCAQCVHWTHLDLGYNQIADEGIAYLSKALANGEKNNNLKCLILDGNQLSSEAAHHLAQMLRVNSTLIELRLDSNQIQHLGAKHLANAFIPLENGSRNSTLTLLSLYENRLHPIGITYLSHALKFAHCPIRHLDLSYNGINGEAYKVVCESLENNSNLHHLDLGELPLDLSDSEQRDIVRILQHNGTLLGVVPPFHQLELLCSRNAHTHAHVRNVVLLVLSIGRCRRNNIVFPREMMHMIAQYVWQTRTHVVAWNAMQDEEKEKQKKKKIKV